MVFICSVIGCVNRTTKSKSKMHRFPLDENFFNLWIKAVSNPIITHKSHEAVYKNHRVCDIHFAEEDLIEAGRRGAGIKENSVPTLFLPMTEIIPSEPIILEEDRPELIESSYSADRISGKETPTTGDVLTRKGVILQSLHESSSKIHFEDSQFENNRVDGWKKLKPNAVPRIFGEHKLQPRINVTQRKSIHKNPGDGYDVDDPVILHEPVTKTFGKMKKSNRKYIPSLDLCRICLSGSSSTVGFEELLNSNEKTTVLGALERVMDCQIELKKNCPAHVCSMCLSLLRISFDLRVQFEETQKKLGVNSVDRAASPDSSKETPSDVEIIVANEKYDLKDILIVEEENEKKEDYTNFLGNLGKTISVKFANNGDEPRKRNGGLAKLTPANNVPKSTPPEETVSSKSQNEVEEIFDDDDEEYETIVIQTVPEDDTSFHWEHEYAKNTKSEDLPGNIPRRRPGRQSKYSDSLMNKINSLIIEGDVATEIPKGEEPIDVEEKSDGVKKRKRWTVGELDQVEKYIIYGSEEDQTSRPAPQWEEDLNKTLGGEQDERDPLELDSEVLKDDLVREALETKHICVQCSMAFATRKGLRRHMNLVHKVTIRKAKSEKPTPAQVLRRKIDTLTRRLRKNPMLCQICGHVSKSSGGAKYHSLTHGEKQFSCSECSKSFYTPSHLKNHLELKHKTVKYKHLCPLCGEYRNSSTALAYHMKIHTGQERKHICSICGLKFLVKSALNNHMRRHKGDRRFSCEICGKSFYTSNELKKHLMIHTGERPHQCKYCDKKFVTPFNLKVHMMTHDGPYLCEFCHKGFIDEEILNMHLKYKHRVALTDSQDQLQSGDEENCLDGQLLEEFNLLPPEEDNLDFEDD